jgi:hypothetical protein
MPHYIHRFALTTIVLLCALIIGAAPASAQTIGGYTLVGQQRIGPITILMFRATLSNPGGTGLAGATATVTSTARATIVLDGQLSFGPVAAGGSVVSRDTITLIHIGPSAFSLSALRWTINAQPAAPPRELRVQSVASIRAGDLFQVVVEAVQGGNVDTSFTGSVTVNAAANGGSDFTAGNVVNAVAGVATFNVFLNNTANGYQIQASAAGLPTVFSNIFAVTARSLDVQPVADQTAGVPFDVIVRALDASGNVAENFFGVVTLSAAADDGADFATPPTVSALNAFASFSGLILQTPATDYSITASASGLISGTSNLFDVAPAVPPVQDVIVVSPRDGATDVATETTVVVTFPRAVNPATLTSANMRLMSGGSPVLFVSTSYSSDGRSVFLKSLLMPSGAVIGVDVSNGVQDLLGLPLGPFASTFTTADMSVARPRVVSQQPGSGSADVAATGIVTLFLDSAIDPATLGAALHLIANGQPVAGTAAASIDGRLITFTPAAPLPSGAIVEVLLDTTALDTSGRSFRHHSGHFRVVAGPAARPPQLVSMSPASGSTDNPMNAVVNLRFDHDLDASTVQGSTVIVRNALGDPVSGIVALVNSRVIRFTPTAPFDPNSVVSIEIASGVHDVDGRAFAGANASFTTGFLEDIWAPVLQMSLQSINVPVDTEIRVGIVPGPGQPGFGESLDLTSIDAGTVTITSAGGGSIAASVRVNKINDTFSELIITPHAPLPGSTFITVTVHGVRDCAGNVASDAVLTFLTAPSGS